MVLLIPLNVFTPTKTRTLTYYDRAAIRLDEVEMKSLRIRLSILITGSPVSRSLNLKYAYPKEFYGYAQAFHRNILIKEWAINYPHQFFYDYWNEHATASHQLVSVLQRLSKFCKVSTDFYEFVRPTGESPANTELSAVREEVKRLSQGFTIETGLGLGDTISSNDSVNSFNHPFDLLRFKFPFGTVFSVTIESWQAGLTSDGSSAGNPVTSDDSPTDNPKGNAPTQTPGGANPQQPYGTSPLPSSPLDPELDPEDFSNAPDPNAGLGYRGHIVGNVQIQGVDTVPRFVDIYSGTVPYPITIGFEPNGGGYGSDIVLRKLDGTLVDITVYADNLGTATLTITRNPI